MSAKQTTKPAPAPRADVSVRVKTQAPGMRRAKCGVIFTNDWKRLLLDDKGSAYKAIAADPTLVMERLPNVPLNDDEAAGETLPADSEPAAGKSKR